MGTLPSRPFASVSMVLPSVVRSSRTIRSSSLATRVLASSSRYPSRPLSRRQPSKQTSGSTGGLVWEDLRRKCAPSFRLILGGNPRVPLALARQRLYFPMRLSPPHRGILIPTHLPTRRPPSFMKTLGSRLFITSLPIKPRCTARPTAPPLTPPRP